MRNCSTATAALAAVAVILAAAAVSAELYWVPAHHLALQGETGRFTVADLDGDGACELWVLGADPVRCFFNEGTLDDPAWEIHPGLILHLPWMSPRSGGFGDMDEDGDLDLVLGSSDGRLRFLRNTGTPHEPTFELDTLLFAGVAIPERPAAPFMADLDADGDLDVGFLEELGHFGYIENIGSSSAPEWHYHGLTLDVEMGYGPHPTCALGDVDCDGDLDFVSVNWNSPPRFWENIGSATAFDFVESEGMLIGVDEAANGAGGVNLLDADCDGDLDLLLTCFEGRRFLYLNDLEGPLGRVRRSPVGALCPGRRD